MAMDYLSRLLFVTLSQMIDGGVWLKEMLLMIGVCMTVQKQKKPHRVGSGTFYTRYNVRLDYRSGGRIDERHKPEEVPQGFRSMWNC